MSEAPAVLRIGSDETELPMIVGTEGERGLDISKLRARGYKDAITPLAASVADYVKNYLVPGKLLGD